jgi:tetratricopeptide (TPR) repeat protein
MLWTKKIRTLLVLFGALVICGCSPTGPGAADEEKEPQFLIGRSRVNAMNFSGAIEAFEDALEMNPRSGAAHFELGWLYAEKQSDPAAAIYHYQKYLKLRPGAANAETIQQHIFRLKQELAKAALPIPPTPEMQRQLEQLTQEKRDLQAEIDRLRHAAAQAANTNRMYVPGGPIRSAGPPNSLIARNASNPNSRTSPVANAPGLRSHRVQTGDTLAAIARRYNVKLESLLAANPRLDPRRMLVGQSITIPPP